MLEADMKPTLRFDVNLIFIPKKIQRLSNVGGWCQPDFQPKFYVFPMLDLLTVYWWLD